MTEVTSGYSWALITFKRVKELIIDIKGVGIHYRY